MAIGARRFMLKLSRGLRGAWGKNSRCRNQCISLMGNTLVLDKKLLAKLKKKGTGLA